MDSRSRPTAATNGTSTPMSDAPGSPLPSAAAAADNASVDEKTRLRREKLAAWKADKAAKATAAPAEAAPSSATPAAASSKPPSPVKAPPAKNGEDYLKVSKGTFPLTSDPAGLPPKPAAKADDPVAAALAAAAAVSSRLSGASSSAAPLKVKTPMPLPTGLPAKPTFSFNQSASTAFRPSNLKKTRTLKLGMGDDEEGETKVGMLKFDGEIDMTVQPAGAGDDEEDDEEDLEGGASYKPKEGGRDARKAILADLEDGDSMMADAEGGVKEEVIKEEVKTEDDTQMQVDVKPEEAGSAPADDEDEEVDELDAFMSGVQAQVKSVDKADKAKLKGKQIIDPDAEEEEDLEEPDEDDEVEKVGMSAAEILA